MPSGIRFEAPTAQNSGVHPSAPSVCVRVRACARVHAWGREGACKMCMCVCMCVCVPAWVRFCLLLNCVAVAIATDRQTDRQTDRHAHTAVPLANHFGTNALGSCFRPACSTDQVDDFVPAISACLRAMPSVRVYERCHPTSARTHTHTHTHTLTHTRTRTRTRIQVYIYRCIQVRANTHTLSHTHTRTYTGDNAK